MSVPKVRQINRPGNGVGKKRQSLYAEGITRLETAIKAGFALEAITLCESLMSDRLEARRAWKAKQMSDARSFSTLGKLARQLCADTSEPDRARDIDAAVVAWADRRNSALHEMFKLAEGDERNWHDRYAETLHIAESGLKLAKKTSGLVRRLNRLPPSSVKSASGTSKQAKGVRASVRSR